MGLEVLKHSLTGRLVDRMRTINREYDLAVFANDHIGGAIITFGQYEPQFLQMTETVLRKLTNDVNYRNGICLDVGANIGNHAFYYSRIFKRIIAFEPNPIAYKLFEASLIKNNISNITLVTKALGQSNKSGNLKVCNENLGMSSLAPHADEHSGYNIQVDIKVGDDLVPELLGEGETISFIKMDVEGFEKDALLGLKQTLAKHHPVIAIELNFLTMNESAVETFQTLKELGYVDFYALTSKYSGMNRLLGYLFRLIRGDRYELERIDTLKREDYQQVYCV